MSLIKLNNNYKFMNKIDKYYLINNHYNIYQMFELRKLTVKKLNVIKNIKKLYSQINLLNNKKRYFD